MELHPPNIGKLREKHFFGEKIGVIFKDFLKTKISQDWARLESSGQIAGPNIEKQRGFIYFLLLKKIVKNFGFF